MLNTFPDLLTLGFFAPTIVRVAVACLFLYAAYAVYKHRRSIAHVRLPLVGTAVWVAGFAALVYALVGAMLLFGYYTQMAAIVGGITALKGLLLHGKFGTLFPYPRSTYLLIAAACLSLLISGAGAFAYDLPL